MAANEDGAVLRVTDIGAGTLAGDDQPFSGPLVSPAITPASPTIVSTAPVMSSPGGAWSFLLSGT